MLYVLFSAAGDYFVFPIAIWLYRKKNNQTAADKTNSQTPR